MLELVPCTLNFLHVIHCRCMFFKLMILAVELFVQLLIRCLLLLDHSESRRGAFLETLHLSL